MKKKFKSGNRNQLSVIRYSLLVLSTLILFACNKTNKKIEVNDQLDIRNRKSEIFYCPMHPEIQQDHPGVCLKPECKGMALIKKVQAGVLDAVLKPVNSSVLSTIKTIHPIEKTVSVNLDVQGFIDYDNRTKHNIACRYNGRIEKLYIKFNYQPVHKGEKIFDIYSPELITAQQNLVFLLNSDAHATELINAAKEKLKLLGFTDEQTNDLVQTKNVRNIVSVFSKWDGHIHEMINEPAPQSNSGGMSSMTAQQTNDVQQNAPSHQLLSTTEFSTKEGMYVTRGQTIFNIVNPHEVVVMLQIRAENISKIKLKQQVEFIIDESPQMTMTGKINFIEPFLKPNAKTILARVDMDNSEHKHKVGALVRAVIKTEDVEGLWIPAKAVIDLGKHKIVWLKNDGHFTAHAIETGVITNDWIEIYDGITAQDEIATEAHYLNDSESFIKIEEEK